MFAILLIWQSIYVFGSGFGVCRCDSLERIQLLPAWDRWPLGDVLRWLAVRSNQVSECTSYGRRIADSRHAYDPVGSSIYQPQLTSTSWRRLGTSLRRGPSFRQGAATTGLHAVVARLKCYNNWLHRSGGVGVVQRQVCLLSYLFNVNCLKVIIIIIIIITIAIFIRTSST